jgi:general secretion pathway protein M
MKAYLSTLNEREKGMLIVGLICLILYCYYWFLYAPLSNQVNQKSLQLVEKTSTLTWMKTVKLQRQKFKPKQVVDNSQLLTILARELKKEFSVKFPYQLQQTGAGDIQLTFDAVPFNLFIGWLKKLNERYAITLKQLNAEHTPTAGVAHILVLLTAIK